MRRSRTAEGESPGHVQPVGPPALALQETHEDVQILEAPPPDAGLVMTLTVLAHPDPDRVGDVALLGDLAPGRPAPLSRLTPDFAGPTGAAPLSDRNLSRAPLFLHLVEGGLQFDIDQCRKRVSIAGELLRNARTFRPSDIESGVVIELSGRVVLLLHRTPSALTTAGIFATGAQTDPASDLTGESAAMRRLRHEIRRVADLSLPVLIRGESGSGKELVAAAIHRESGRRKGPFVAVNLGAITASLASAELFGAERGAYTGAFGRRAGYFAQAHGGTLFLDELGEAPAEVQVALLRAIETGQIQPVGSSQPQSVDVRVIAATDADLEAKMAGGAFKAPLFNRLAAYELLVPPLRDRKDDIGRLLFRFLREELSAIGDEARLRSAPETGELWFPASLVAKLAEYDWPGNVRQLHNVVRQLIVGSRGRDRVELTPAVERQLREGKFPRRDTAPSAPPATPVSPLPAPPSPAAPAQRGKRAPLTEVSVEEALRKSRWDIAAAAQALGVSRAAVYAVMEDNPRFRKAGDLSTGDLRRAYERSGGDVGRMVEDLEVSERALRRRLRELGFDA